jgi:hypothetical protein
MNNTRNIIIACTLFFLVACDTENELKRSVFVPDPENPELPSYSEWGYNTFGAYYDRTIIVSNYDDVPAKIIVGDGSTSFRLDGDRKTSEFSVGESIQLDFVFPDMAPTTYADLVDLNETTFDLIADNVTLIISTQNGTAEAEILEGDLTFVRAQTLIVDEEQHEVILSGTFNVKFVVDNVAVTISEGRFDVGIGPDNFFGM